MNTERKFKRVGTGYVDSSVIEDAEVSFVITQLEGLQKKLLEDHPNAVRFEFNCSDGDFNVVAYRLETDEEYGIRTYHLAVQLQLEQERELATLKKLQAKYPDVKFEL